MGKDFKGVLAIKGSFISHQPTWPGGYHFGLGGNRSAVRPLVDALSMVATGGHSSSSS
jgi:hypothetical protein